MADANTFAAVEHNVRIFQVTKWVNISSLVTYIYELLITFDEEVNLIWSGSLSPGKVLFILNRYLTLATLLFINIILNLREVSPEMFAIYVPAGSLAWIRVHWIGGSIIGCLSELTLQLRLYAMYNGSRTIFVLLITVTMMTLGSMLGIFITVMKTEEAEFLDFGDAAEQHMCIPKDIIGLFKVFWIPILVNEALQVALAVFKGIQTSRSMPDGWWSGRAPNRFLRFLVRDSVLFFLIVFASFFANELMWVIGGSDYIETPVGFAIASASIWSQRLLLNIRRHRQAPVEDLIVTVDSSMPDFEPQHRARDV